NPSRIIIRVSGVRVPPPASREAPLRAWFSRSSEALPSSGGDQRETARAKRRRGARRLRTEPSARVRLAELRTELAGLEDEQQQLDAVVITVGRPSVPGSAQEHR